MHCPLRLQPSDPQHWKSLLQLLTDCKQARGRFCGQHIRSQTLTHGNTGASRVTNCNDNRHHRGRHTALKRVFGFCCSMYLTSGSYVASSRQQVSPAIPSTLSQTRLFCERGQASAYLQQWITPCVALPHIAGAEGNAPHHIINDNTEVSRPSDVNALVESHSGSRPLASSPPGRRCTAAPAVRVQ
jgi:hypothetical protein